MKGNIRKNWEAEDIIVAKLGGVTFCSICHVPWSRARARPHPNLTNGCDTQKANDQHDRYNPQFRRLKRWKNISTRANPVLSCHVCDLSPKETSLPFQAQITGISGILKDLRGLSRKEQQTAVMPLSKVLKVSGSKDSLFEFSVTKGMQHMEHAVVSIVEIRNRHDRAVSEVCSLD